MKVRTGFVSNSSSSSFVLSTNKTDEEIYNDILIFFKKYSEYKNFMNGKENNEVPTLNDIKENVEILRTGEDGVIDNPFIYTWYTEDHEQPDDFFKNKIVIYGEGNFLPNELDDFFFCRHLYTHEYTYFDSCTHMG